MFKPRSIAEYKDQQDRARKLEAEAKAIVEEWINANFEPDAVHVCYKPLPGLTGHHLVLDGMDHLSVWYDAFSKQVLWN